MVIFLQPFNTCFVFLLLAQQRNPALKLPEPVRQSAYMSLIGIALLGMFLIVGILLGGHWVRRWGDRQRRSAVPPDVIVPRSNTPQDGEAGE